MDDELARDVIERAQHRRFLGLSGRRHAQVRTRLRPRSREIGMRQCLALVAVEKNDVAGFGLTLAQLQAQADPIHLAGRLPSLQRVSGPPPSELFFRNTLDNCDRLMRTPSRASISARKHRPCRNRCAIAEPCPRARQTPRRSADWSSPPASAARHAPYSLPRD